MGRKTQCCSDSKGYKGSVVSCRPELVMPETTVSNNLHETKTDPLFIKPGVSSGELPICTLLWPFDIRDNVPFENFCFHSVVTLTHAHTHPHLESEDKRLDFQWSTWKISYLSSQLWVDPCLRTNITCAFGMLESCKPRSHVHCEFGREPKWTSIARPKFSPEGDVWKGVNFAWKDRFMNDESRWEMKA